MAIGHWQAPRIGMPWRLALWLAVAGAALLYGMVFTFSPTAAIILWLAGLLTLVLARHLEWAALWLFFLVPLGRLTWLNDTGTLDLTKLFVAALAIGWFARSLATRDRKLVSVWTESPITVLIMLFLLVNLISLLNAWDLRRSLFSLVRLIGLFGLYVLIVAMVRRKRQVATAMILLLLTGLIICLLGVWESLTHRYLWDVLGQAPRTLPPGLAGASGALGVAPFAVRIITVFVDYNFMGGYMAVLLGIVGGCAMATRRWYLLVALAGMTALILYNAVQTGSRGGVMGICVTALLLLVLSRVRVRWFVLVLLVVGAIAVLPIADQLAPQFRGGISLADLKQDQRWGYWQMAIHMMQDHPIIGVGTDNFVSLYSWYRISPALMSPYYCHNIYLQMWAEAGIFGLIAIMSIVTAVGLTYARAVRQAGDEAWRGLVVGLFAAFVGYAVFSGTCNTLHDQPFWVLMALSVVVARINREEKLSAVPSDGRDGPSAELPLTPARALATGTSPP